MDSEHVLRVWKYYKMSKYLHTEDNNNNTVNDNSNTKSKATFRVFSENSQAKNVTKNTGYRRTEGQTGVNQYTASFSKLGYNKHLIHDLLNFVIFTINTGRP